MYAELLQTPHSRRLNPEQGQRPLIEALDRIGIVDRLTSAELSDRHFDQLCIEADTISQQVHATFVFRPNVSGEFDLTPEAMSEEQLADCQGHTVVLSECLQEVQIPHFIGYANGHGFVVLTNFKDKAHLIDATSPYFNGDMMPALQPDDLSKVEKLIAQYGYGAVRFRSDLFVDSHPAVDRELDSLSTKHRWLTKDKRINLGSGYGMSGRSFINRAKFVRNHTLITTLLTPEDGKEAIVEVERFRHDMATGNNSGAYKHLRAIDGRYPEVDSMVQKKEIEDFVHRLAARGYIALALGAVESVASTYKTDISQDIRLQAWRGDMLRDIGRIMRNPDVIDLAIQAYDEVPGSEYSLHIQGKIHKSRGIKTHI